MADLLLNPLTKKRIESFLARPSHALILVGQRGSDLPTIATYIRKYFTGTIPDADALVSVVPNDKGTIPIEDIRALGKRLKLRNSSVNEISIAIVISSAEAMQGDAQNSLLKLLEEPPRGVLFILLTHEPSKILPTISSRCVNLEVLPISLEQAQDFFDDTSPKIIRNYHLSGGQAGLLQELVNNPDHPLVLSIEAAKQLLAATPYDRLKLIDISYKGREAAYGVVTALLRVCTAALQSGHASERWVRNSRMCVETIKKLEANVQAKLALDELFLNLR